MVRKRGRSRRSYGIKRAKKQRIKLDPKTISLRFKERIEPMSTNISYWLNLLDQLEKEILPLLVKYGIPTEEFVNYLAYAKRLFSKVSRFKALTLFNEILNWVAIFVTRGLRRDVLEKLVNPTITVWQWQFDYLRYILTSEVIGVLPRITKEFLCKQLVTYILYPRALAYQPPLPRPPTALYSKVFLYSFSTEVSEYPAVIKTPFLLESIYTKTLIESLISMIAKQIDIKPISKFIFSILEINPQAYIPSYPLSIFELRPIQEASFSVKLFYPFTITPLLIIYEKNINYEVKSYVQ